MLDVQDITVAYSSNAEPTIEGFHLKMKPGEICSIVGESGSGKTTVIRSILGLLPSGGKVTKGDILFEGESLLQYSKKQWRELRGTQISMIFQDSGAMINPIRKIGSQYVEYIRAHKNISKKDAFGMAVEMLEKMRLPDGKRIMESYPFELSGGQKKRVAIAGVLAMNPKILILDEPTAGLDPKGRDEILDQIAELHKVRGITIVLVSHSMEDVAKYAERLIVVNHGQIAFDDTPKKVFAHYKEMEPMGLAAPQITYIMHALKEKGLNVDPSDTTVEEAKQDILNALRKMNSPLLKGGAQND